MASISATSASYVQHKSRFSHIARRIGLYALVLLVCIATLFPIYWMVVSAIQPVTFSLSYPPPLFPQQPSLEPFQRMFNQFPIWGWLGNTILLSTITTII